MQFKNNCAFVLLSVLAASELGFGREIWLERAGRAVYLHPRRFGVQNPPVLQKLASACDGAVCGNLAGQAVGPLLAASPECAQQDFADQIIDASRQFDEATQANMIAIAQEYRTAEKNTIPDFQKDPPTLRNSVFCQKTPKNPELIGLVQAQDPANDPEVFFDPATRASVIAGTQANTIPPAVPINANADNNVVEDANADDIVDEDANADDIVDEDANADDIVDEDANVDNSVDEDANADNGANADDIAGDNGDIADDNGADGADFGSCSTPEIEFAAGIDGRSETAFQPADKSSFSQGSAQNINIITRAICDTLINTCDANDAALTLCDQAKAAASAAPVGTGAQADAFNAVFGIQTNFDAVQPLDNQGRPVVE